MAWRRELQKAWSRLNASRNPLTALANRYGSDKGTRNYDAHHYTRVYDALFRERRTEPLRLLEIGLLNSRSYSSWKRRNERYAGTAAGNRAPSLEMWSRYFPAGTIVGFDINDFSSVSLPRCRIIRGDMGSRQDLERLIEESGGGFDIIIDDASHASHHQQIALGFLFPQLSAGGLYIVEDLHWQPPELELPTSMKTRDLLRRAAVLGTFESPLFLSHERAALERDVSRIRFYDSAMRERPLEADDALAVIYKRR